jgi:PAS domain S-box-containing protein
MPNDRSFVDLLLKVSREFAGALDLKTVLTRVLFAALNHVGGERASIVVMDESGNAVDSAIVYGNQLRESTTLQLRETIDRGLAGWVVRNRRPALVPDTSKDERWLRREDDQVSKSGAKSAICVPLMAREKLSGVMTLVHPMPRAFNDQHLELMQAIADQAGMAVLNARLFTESQRQARVMTALAESAVAMNTSLRAEQTYERIIQQTQQALQVETAVLGMIDPSTGNIFFRAAAGPAANTISRRMIKAGEGIAGIVVREGRGLIVSSVAAETRMAEAERASGRVTAMLCAPIHAQGKVIGVLEAFNPLGKTFDPDALLVLTGLGGLAGAVIQNAQLYERLNAAHQRYRELFQDSVDPIVITDLDGNVTEANRNAELLSGYSTEELRQFKIEKIHVPNRQKLGETFQNASRAAIVYEAALVDKSGSTHPVEVHVRKVIFDEVRSLQWLLRDITERKEIDSLREDLTAMIYHDLRSPLANILSSVEMLGTMVAEQEKEIAEPVLRIAHHSIDRIQRLVSSLLDLSRLEQNQPVANRQAIDIGLLFHDVLDAVSQGAESRGQNLRLEQPDGLPPILVDGDMIRRVIINLVENAVKYTPSKGVISFGAGYVPGDLWLTCWVQDNGPGILDGDKEKVFDKFARLVQHKNGPSGLGVGLAFCKLAVQGHGGKIWVEDAPVKGSRFVFTLPVAHGQ